MNCQGLLEMEPQVPTSQALWTDPSSADDSWPGGSLLPYQLFKRFSPQEPEVPLVNARGPH